MPALLLVTDDPQRRWRCGAWAPWKLQRAPYQILCVPTRLRQGIARPWTAESVAAKRRSKQRDTEGVALVGHEKERRHAGPKFASGPAPRQGNGRGYRRGLDGPTMPKPILKMESGICPNRQAATSEGRWGTLIGEVKEGIGPEGQGGTGANQSPPPATLRSSRHATLRTPKRTWKQKRNACKHASAIPIARPQRSSATHVPSPFEHLVTTPSCMPDCRQSGTHCAANVEPPNQRGAA